MAPCDWDVDPGDYAGVCPDWASYSADVREAALELAVGFLWGATGRRFGVCPVTVRPGGQRMLAAPAYAAFPVWPGQEPAVTGPYLYGGTWFNAPAGCSSACCGSAGCAVVLRGPVASVEEVLIGEETVPPSAYRVDVSGGAWLLQRIDGECWPGCQNMAAEEGEPGSFVITYGAGVRLPAMLKIATAALACEFGKSLIGGACSLPAKMTRLSRQGVEVEVASPDPAAGTTGVKLVDDVIATLNPSGRKSPPLVLSPDLPEACDRSTVIPAGS